MRCLASLQVATSDGRVKFVGRDGVECTACTTSQTATRYLQFLPKKGALLRVTQVPANIDSLNCYHLTEHTYINMQFPVSGRGFAVVEPLDTETH